MTRSPVSVVIPTYERGPVLVDTVRLLLAQEPAASEVILVDQTAQPEPEVAAQLETWERQGAVRWLRRTVPSVPQAMNHGLGEAKAPIVLFVDDDIVPGPGMIGEHARNYADPDTWAVVGQILQPGQSPLPGAEGGTRRGIWRDLEFSFNGGCRRQVFNCMAGNLSVRRERALQAGGFDESFLGVAYRFETEFCRRLIRLGGNVLFDPAASLRHLQAPRGGIRAWGGHLRSASPAHSVGDYYFAFRESTGSERIAYVLRRLLRSVRTRYHVRHPWWIPVKLAGEVRGLWRAYRLSRESPRLLTAGGADARKR
jgi:GT2 family glycosyltransferase